DLLSHAQNYINYEEKMLGEKLEKAKILPKKDERAIEERGRRIPRTLQGRKYSGIASTPNSLMSGSVLQEK
ncbi:hypothetical protein A2U01_0042138, partial [Trifolium medium]|nr:hypothetical protein [Trifolium medium]